MDYRANETKTLRFQTIDPTTWEVVTPTSLPTANLVLDGTVGSSLTVSGSAGDYSVAIAPGSQPLATTVQVKITWSYAGVTRVMYPPEMCGRVTVEQTGDAFARLGAPTGASVSADIASTHSRLGAPAGASTAADIAAVMSRLGAPAGASLAADIATIDTNVDAANDTLDAVSNQIVGLGAQIWVDAINGSDSGDGSVTAPKQTIAAAITALDNAGARDGATIHLAPGGYTLTPTQELYGGAAGGLRILGAGRQRTQLIGNSSSTLCEVDLYTILCDLSVLNAGTGYCVQGICEMKRVSIIGEKCLTEPNAQAVQAAILWEDVNIRGKSEGINIVGDPLLYPRSLGLFMHDSSIYLDSEVSLATPSTIRPISISNYRLAMHDSEVVARCSASKNVPITLLYLGPDPSYVSITGCTLAAIQQHATATRHTVNSVSGSYVHIAGCYVDRDANNALLTTGAGTVNFESTLPKLIYDIVKSGGTGVPVSSAGATTIITALLATDNSGDTVSEQLIAAAAGGGGGSAPSVAEIVAGIETEVFGAKTLQQHLDGLLTAVNALPTASSIATQVWGTTIDTIAASKHLQAQTAVLAGVATVSGSTVSYKGRDGSTTVAAVTVGSNSGERSASTIT